jgi:hypothetical protein
MHCTHCSRSPRKDEGQGGRVRSHLADDTGLLEGVQFTDEGTVIRALEVRYVDGQKMRVEGVSAT